MRILNFFFIISSFTLHSQINFFEEYGGNGNDFGQGIVQLEDSSYVITGASSSFSGFQTDAFLLCLDSLGQYKWSTYFGGEESDWGRRVLYSPNDGFYVAGYSNSDVSNGFDFYLVKTDLTGIPQWQKRHGTTAWEKVYDAALTRDTGVIMVGERDSGTANGKDMLIMRTDKAGDTLWTKEISSIGDDYFTSIAQWNDSIYVAAGRFYVADSSQSKGLLLCFHEDGTEQWRDTIGVNGEFFFNQVIIKEDTLQGVGGMKEPGTEDWDTWRVSYLMQIPDLYYEIQEHTDQDYIAQGMAYYNWDDSRIMPHSREGSDYYPGGEDIFYAKMDYYMWTMNSATCWVAREGQDELGQIISTSDGGVIGVGYTSQRVGVNSNWVYAMKIGPNDSYPWQDEVGPVLQLVGQKELLLLSGISVYPNPTNDKLQIRSEQAQSLILEIYDLSGSLVLGTSMNQKIELDLSNFQSGMYLLHLENPESGATVVERIQKF